MSPRAAIIASCFALGACDPDPEEPPIDPVVTQAELESGAFVEVMPCRASHDHDLRSVRTVANTKAVDLYRRCVLDPQADCPEGFPAGAMLVKYEYDASDGCDARELVSLTASLKLAPGALPEGYDWRWQRLTPRLQVVEDGAPTACILCHIDHCGGDGGHDLRCLPD